MRRQKKDLESRCVGVEHAAIKKEEFVEKWERGRGARAGKY